MPFSFVLCPECLAQYRALTHDPICGYMLNSIPLCSLEWSDEHPRDGVIASPDLNHQECRTSLIRLVAARTHLWKTGAVPEEAKELWANAQDLIPHWPGFRRLSLSPEERRSLEACAEELADFLGAMAADFPELKLTDQGGGLTQLVARRGETKAPPRAPLLVMEFAKGSARALALEFYPSSVAAIAQELRQVPAILRNWQAKYGDHCEQVLFTIVSATEDHPAFESLIRQWYRDEAELPLLLKSMEVRLALANPASSVETEIPLRRPGT
jgi:hypothetical protein